LPHGTGGGGSICSGSMIFPVVLCNDRRSR
jgi:hypothetical protein